MTDLDTRPVLTQHADAVLATDAPFTGTVGQSLLRKEDPKLLTGEGKYTDDLVITGASWIALVRSPYAHARILSVDGSAALEIPGVTHVFSGMDLAGDTAAAMPCAWPVTADMKNPEHHPVARDVARYVGDAVAVVVADSKAAAEDALAAVVVEYEALPAVIDLEEALSNKHLVHESLGTNTTYVWDLKPAEEAVNAAFAAAAHTVKGRYIQQRLIPAAMEPRSVAVVPQPFGGEFVVYSATQIPHILKVMLGLTVGIPEQKLRVIAPAVGGGFGSKLNVYAEEVLCLALAKRLRKPVRWTETRSEGTQATIHGRGQIQEIELAADANGKVTACKVNLLADMGAYLQLVTPGVPLLGAFLYTGVYDIQLMSFSCTAVFTTKTPTDAYRGAGRPEASYAIERAMDTLAYKLKMDPAELRRINFIAPEAFPYTSAGTLVFDSGNYDGALTKALAHADYAGKRAKQKAERASGAKKITGIGISSYFEMCGLAPSRALAGLNYSAGGWEAATVRILPTCKVQVISGATPHGQGHETSWSQIVADKLGISPDDVEVLHSDTAISPLGLDTYGSRSLAVGGVAIWHATDKVIVKAKAIAAHQLEAAEEDLEFGGGVFSVKGSPDRNLPLAAIAFGAFTAHNLPDGLEPNLEAHCTWDPPNFVFPFGTHIAIVEIDTETGKTDLVEYIAVDDCGNQINPLIVQGQVHGGVVQGVAQALWEEAVYDSAGNLLTSTFADYLIPSAAEVPNITTDHTVTPSPSNPMGVKGVGEAGTIGAAQAVINAIVDALSPLGVTDIEMPASPQRVWETIQQFSKPDSSNRTAGASA
jgi:aerobic carbon-monoxide dehydrogenase large subunit